MSARKFAEIAANKPLLRFQSKGLVTDPDRRAFLPEQRPGRKRPKPPDDLSPVAAIMPQAFVNVRRMARLSVGNGGRNYPATLAAPDVRGNS
jgi:hypothetical protein